MNYDMQRPDSRCALVSRGWAIFTLARRAKQGIEGPVVCRLGSFVATHGRLSLGAFGIGGNPGIWQSRTVPVTLASAYTDPGSGCGGLAFSQKIIIHLLGLAPAGWVAAPDKRA
jgi:hypothetical protein